jgi:Fe-Mn family superoxide dismutase
MSSHTARSRLSDSPLQAPVDQAPPFVAREFDFNAVEGLSVRALELHKGLYEGYVKEANSLLPLIITQPGSKEVSTQERLQYDGLARRFAFEHNGMLLHELFFEALSGSSEPPRARSAFGAAVEKSYGGFEAWQEDVRKLAQTRGVGWVLTVHSVRDNRLRNIWIDEHSHGVLIDCRTICAIDLWEHAYLIDYKPSGRLKYVQAVFDNIDWEVVARRCER